MMRRFGIRDVRPLTGVRRDEAVPFGLEVARVADYAIRHQTCVADDLFSGIGCF